jgi:hypothetical protein
VVDSHWNKPVTTDVLAPANSHRWRVSIATQHITFFEDGQAVLDSVGLFERDSLIADGTERIRIPALDAQARLGVERNSHADLLSKKPLRLCDSKAMS